MDRMTNRPLSSKPVLVTGGGGFLGGALAAMLTEQGAAVRSFSRSRHRRLERLRIEQFRGDLGDPGALLNACRGVDIVFHVAAKTGVWGAYRDFHRTNVTGTQNVIAACRSAGVQRLVYTSSPSVIFNGRDMEGIDESVPYPARYLAHYPRTKALAEQLVRRAGERDLRTIVLRPHLIWGPGDNHLVPRIIHRARRLRKVGQGRNKVDTTYVDNAAYAHILAARKLGERPSLSGRVYFISQGEPVPLWDMVNAILAAADLPPVERVVAPQTARRVGALLEWIYRSLQLPGEPPMTRFVAEELATAHWFDLSAAREDLDYRPLVSTREGLERLRRWLQQEKPVV